MAARLTPLSKFLITAVVLGGIGTLVYKNKDKLAGLAPEADKPKTNVPPVATLPDDPGPAVAEGGAGCADKPEIRFYHWAWNAQAGLILANGGKQAAEGSLMCKHGVNLKLIREDNTDQMQALLATFAEGLKKGESNPSAGAHFIAIMGDGSATFLKALNDRLRKLGPDYGGIVVGSAGYSRGEDKFMGPSAWKGNPQKARGGLVAGVLRDGDWNIALKWLGDNRIPNNPDETTYDPEALNWVNASDYIDAGQKYVSGFCTELKNSKTGAKEKHCVDGVVTWTPGDVTVAEKKGGLVSIVSTKEYRSQMPNVIIGSKKWVNAHRDTVKGMLQAMFDAGDMIKHDDEALRRAAALSALVYKEKDAAYWYKYFHVVTQNDAQGLSVELGGSAVNNLADNVQLFGLAPGSANIFAATYTVFGDIVKSQYPKLVPSYYPVNEILDASLVKELAASAGSTASGVAQADLPKFTGERIFQVVSRRAWDIKFATGSAKFKPEAVGDLKAMFKDLVVASGTIVEIHGHTDDQGSVDKNQRLSEDRAFAVKKWLQDQSNANFPAERIKVFAHGSQQPLDSNSSAEGRAKNRRVEIVLGTGTQT
ncbi:MAG TPA: phosphate ABC transporter substrate-binding/OmpA family protein [Polyangia bacterium]|jgi:outer membrane protein OmpA-like peptidoglycan-associated protein|nr:phosphate ABC transporter substrate-binding/OmpA family protein [Polyangia bacterium]